MANKQRGKGLVGQRGRRFGDPEMPPELGALYQFQKGHVANPTGRNGKVKMTGSVKAAIRECAKLKMPPAWRSGDGDIAKGAEIAAVIGTLLLRDACKGDRFAIAQILGAEPKEVIFEGEVELGETGLADRMDALAALAGEAELPRPNGANGSNGAGSDHLQ